MDAVRLALVVSSRGFLPKHARIRVAHPVDDVLAALGKVRFLLAALCTASFRLFSIHCFRSSVRAATGLLALALATALSLAEYLDILNAASASSGCEAAAAASSVMVDSGVGSGRRALVLGCRFFLRSLSCPFFPPPFQGPVCLPSHFVVRPLTLRSA